jgi:hypothetical protein
MTAATLWLWRDTPVLVCHATLVWQQSNVVINWWLYELH